MLSMTAAMQWGDELDSAVDVKVGQSTRVLRWWGGEEI